MASTGVGGTFAAVWFSLMFMDVEGFLGRGGGVFVDGVGDCTLSMAREERVLGFEGRGGAPCTDALRAAITLLLALPGRALPSSLLVSSQSRSIRFSSSGGGSVCRRAGNRGLDSSTDCDVLVGFALSKSFSEAAIAILKSESSSIVFRSIVSSPSCWRSLSAMRSPLRGPMAESKKPLGVEVVTSRMKMPKMRPACSRTTSV